MKIKLHYVYIRNNITKSTSYIYCYMTVGPVVRSNKIGFRRRVRCSVEVVATHASAGVATTWISYPCVPCHPWRTHRTYLVVKKKSFQFSCGCEQFH